MDRRSLIAGAASAGVALAAPTAAQAQGMAPSLAELFAATLTAHDMVAFASLFADDYTNHQVSAAAPPSPGPSTKTAKQGSVDFFAARLAAMPDLKVAVEASVITADKVAASFVYTGTHRGVYFGIAPTGRPLRFTSCDIFRVQNGKFVEHWGMGDIAGILAQLRAPA
jgi:predicted ester cyclase